MKRGVSLVEVVMAASLLSLVMLFLFNIIPASAIATRGAEHRLAADSLAQSVLDQAASLPFGSLVDGTYDAASPGLLGLADQRLEDGTLLVVRATISPSPGGAPRTRLLLVRVEVTWRERTRNPVLVRELQLSAVRR